MGLGCLVQVFINFVMIRSLLVVLGLMPHGPEWLFDVIALVEAVGLVCKLLLLFARCLRQAEVAIPALSWRVQAWSRVWEIAVSFNFAAIQLVLYLGHLLLSWPAKADMVGLGWWAVSCIVQALAIAFYDLQRLEFYLAY